MSDWQPMETAPRDGTPVLLCLRRFIDRPVQEAVWRGDLAMPCWDMRLHWAFDSDAEAWCPLPLPPDPRQAEKKEVRQCSHGSRS
jgi:hypothetical protein